MTDDQKTMVRQAAREAIREWLVLIGVDASEPSDLIELQKDFAHIRKQRQASEQVSMAVKGAGITTVVMGALTALWIGVRDVFHSPWSLP